MLVSSNLRENKLLLLFINPRPSVPLFLIPRVLFLFPWPVFTSRGCFYTCCFATCYSVQPSRKLAANAARSAARPSFDRRRTFFLQKYNFQLFLDRTTLFIPKLNSLFFCDPKWFSNSSRFPPAPLLCFLKQSKSAKEYVDQN